MRIKHGLAVFIAGTLTAASIAVGIPEAALADGTTGAANEVVVALDTVDARNGNLVAEPVPSEADADSAAQTAVVDIPADPTRGVKLKGKDGQTLTIRLPGARKSDRGKKARSGVVVYGSKGDSLNAAIPTADGSVQLWTHIRNSKASETYRYCVDGVTFHVQPNGGAIGVNQTNRPVTIVPPPTATEKKTGKPVATSYTAGGNCLVQHVAHKAKGVQHPVTADPWFVHWWGISVELNRNQTNNVMLGMAGAAAASLYLPNPVVNRAVSAILILSGGYANWAYNRGACLALNWAWNGQWWIWHYYGGNCR